MPPLVRMALRVQANRRHQIALLLRVAPLVRPGRRGRESRLAPVAPLVQPVRGDLPVREGQRHHRTVLPLV